MQLRVRVPSSKKISLQVMPWVTCYFPLLGNVYLLFTVCSICHLVKVVRVHSSEVCRRVTCAIYGASSLRSWF